MDEFINDVFAVAGGTILSYSGSDISLSIPEKMGGADIVCIGNGAFMDSAKMCQVFIPYGVKQIGSEAFSGCTLLRNVYIPGTVKSFGMLIFSRDCQKLSNLIFYDIRLTKECYYELRLQASKVNGTGYIAHHFPNVCISPDSLENVCSVKAANFVSGDTVRLFSVNVIPSEKGLSGLRQNLDGFSFDGEGICGGGGNGGDNTDSRYSSEEAEIKKMMKMALPVPTDKKTEAANDMYVRAEKTTVIEKTAVFFFDDAKTRQENGTYIITANVRIGYHFWPSLVPIVFNGRQYYIYRRNFLCPGPNINYIRKDAAVFSDNGFVSDRREAYEVYAKYRLVSIL